MIVIDKLTCYQRDASLTIFYYDSKRFYKKSDCLVKTTIAKYLSIWNFGKNLTKLRSTKIVGISSYIKSEYAKSRALIALMVRGV